MGILGILIWHCRQGRATSTWICRNKWYQRYQWVPSHTHQIWTQSAQPFARYRKVVCSDAYHLSLTCVKVAGWSLTTRNNYTYHQLVSKHAPNLNVIGPAVVELPSPRVGCLRHLLTQHVPRAVVGTGEYRCLSNKQLIRWWHRAKLVMPFQRYKRLRSVTMAGRSYWLFSDIYVEVPGVPKNVPHLNLEYLKNYARDVHDFGVIRKPVSWKFLCFDEHIRCHEATRY